MGNSTGQLTHGFKLLRLPKLRGNLLALLDCLFPLANCDGEFVVRRQLTHERPKREGRCNRRDRRNAEYGQSRFAPVVENLVESPSDVDDDRKVLRRRGRN